MTLTHQTPMNHNLSRNEFNTTLPNLYHGTKINQKICKRYSKSHLAFCYYTLRLVDDLDWSMWVGSLVVAIMDMTMHMKDITQILLQGIMTDMDMSVNRQPAHKIREVLMQIVLKLKVVAAAAAVDTTIEQILKTASITRVTHNMMMKNTTNHLVSLEVVGGRVAGHITCQTCLMDPLRH
jgi:citrate lyase gamma subunit